MTHYPPPGAVPPPGSPPPPPPPPPWGQAPYRPMAYGPPVHQPGVVPLRPLTLGDFFGGPMATIRRNPGATLGLAAAVTTAFMLVPIVLTLVAGTLGLLPSMDPLSGSVAPDSSILVSYAGSGIGWLFRALATIVVTGLTVRVVEQAVVGERLTAGQAWRATRGRLLGLAGLALLLFVVGVVVVTVLIGGGILLGASLGGLLATVLLGILGGLLAVVALVFLYVRYGLLAAPNLVVEGRGIWGSLRRAAELSRGQFWRLLGISLLMGLVVGVAGSIIAVPFSLLGVLAMFALHGSWAMTGYLLSTYVATVVVGSLVVPFSSGVTALQYYDQRFRKEGHDIELLERALGRDRP